MASWLLQALVALVAGLLQAASIAAPWDGRPNWWLQWASLAVFAWLGMRVRTALAAGALGWLFAIAWLCGTFWWLFVSMHTYGGLAAPLAALAVLALAAFLGSYYGLAMFVLKRLGELNPLAGSLAFAALWTLAELMRGGWFTGFPWGAGGYAHVEGPLAAIAPLAGVYGIGFVAAMLAWGLGGLLGRRGLPARGAWWPLMLCALLMLGANLAVPAQIQAQGQPVKVALLQGNISQGEKFEPSSGIPAALRWYGEQLQSTSAQLVVAPETAVPLLPSQLPAGYLDALAAPYRAGAQAALVGIPLGSLSEGYTNSAIGFKPGGPAYRYDKHHLVPFGEFIPPLFRWFTNLMHIPLGDFNRGDSVQPSFEWAGQRFAPNICYEDLFGDELGARFARPAWAPTVFVNLSNIAWFGDSVAIDQHLQISRMRALEFARPVVRATNTGATALIDHEGRVVQQLPRLTRGVLTQEVQGYSGITVYAAWVSQAGLWPLWLLCLAVVALTALRARLRRVPDALAGLR